MKFQKLNDNVIRCLISREEMISQGINIDDLLADRGKAESFLQYVLSAAKYEADFAINGDVLNVQLSVLQDGEISMMISDDQNAVVRAIAEQFKNKLKEIQEALSVAASGDGSASTKRLIHDAISDKADEDLCDYTFWARLSDMDECISMAKALEELPTDTKSDLYRYSDEYFFSIRLFGMTKSQIARHVFVMSEYSDDVSSETKEYLMVAEHGRLIIKDEAIDRLIELG